MSDRKRNRIGRVFSNLAISVDGKIATESREMISLGSAKDLRLLRKLRNGADAVVFGAEVLRAFRGACLPLDPKQRIVNAVLSHRLDRIDPNWPFFSNDRIDRILYVTEKLSPERTRKFSKMCEIVHIDSKSIAKAMLADLAKRGYRMIAVEGGGALMWEFVRADRIEEYFVTVVPRIVGGKNAPTMVDGVGFTPSQLRNLRLKRSRRVGSELFLVYEPIRPSGKTHPLY
jgi:riboflavin-specific deaminase-like protein